MACSRVFAFCVYINDFDRSKSGHRMDICRFCLHHFSIKFKKMIRLSMEKVREFTQCNSIVLSKYLSRSNINQLVNFHKSLVEIICFSFLWKAAATKCTKYCYFVGFSSCYKIR